MKHRHNIIKIMALACAISFSVLAAPAASPAIQAQAAGSNEQLIFEILTEELGFNVAAACGILANIKAESNFRPGALSGAGSYGLCQWTGGRRSNLYGWCGSNGYEADTIEGQLHFLEHELRSSYGSVYRYLTSVDNTKEGAYNAGWYWCYYFERPANRSGQSNRRGNMAAGSFWNNYSKYLSDRWMDTSNGRMYMYRGGTYHTGWMTMDGDDYYFDSDGILKTGWFTVDASTYFADENGVKVTGWYNIDNSTYYFGLDGSLQKGWIEVDGKQYFLGQNGRLTNSETAIGGGILSSASIQNAVTASGNTPDQALTAPASDPVALDDAVNNAVSGIYSAGAAGASNTAGIVNTDTPQATSGVIEEQVSEDYVNMPIE